MHIQAQAVKDIALLPRIYLNWIEHISSGDPFEAKEQQSSIDTGTRLGTRLELQDSSATIPSATLLYQFQLGNIGTTVPKS
jgi:hypothetical protein